MLILVAVDNIEKKFDYIVRIIEYKLDEHDDFVISKWENLLGTPYVNISGNLFGNKQVVKEDRIWLKYIFEHLIVSSMWKWR